MGPVRLLYVVECYPTSETFGKPKTIFIEAYSAADALVQAQLEVKRSRRPESHTTFVPTHRVVAIRPAS
jgi:hypothetical protein